MHLSHESFTYMKHEYFTCRPRTHESFTYHPRTRERALAMNLA